MECVNVNGFMVYAIVMNSDGGKNESFQTLFIGISLIREYCAIIHKSASRQIIG